MVVDYETMHEIIQERGFATLDLQISEQKVLEIYRCFDMLSIHASTSYDAQMASLDQEILSFLTRPHILTTNVEKIEYPFLFKYLKKDTEKHKALSQGSIKHEMTSFHYVEGLYEFLSRKTWKVPSEIWTFFKLLNEIVEELAHHLMPLIKKIEARTAYLLSMKVWKHSPDPDSTLLLPLHHDHSIFSVIIHTRNPQEECLHIFPSKFQLEEVEQKSKHYPLTKSDFPLIMPGLHAKTHLNMEPTPHKVITPAGERSRYSLVFFIGNGRPY